VSTEDVQIHLGYSFGTSSEVVIYISEQSRKGVPLLLAFFVSFVTRPVGSLEISLIYLLSIYVPSVVKLHGLSTTGFYFYL